MQAHPPLDNDTPSNKWAVRIGEGSERHVVPVGDLREHVETTKCWCRPLEDIEYYNIWIHNSMDRREFIEDGTQKVQ